MAKKGCIPKPPNRFVEALSWRLRYGWRQWSVTIYVNHHAVGDAHNLTRLQSIRLVKQLNQTEQNRDNPVAGRRYCVR